MKQLLAILLTTLLAGETAFGQQPDGGELGRLMNIVASLRQTDNETRKSNWEKASADLADDERWTMMDEVDVKAPDAQCSLSDKSVQRFSLNRILSRRMGYDQVQVRGDFNNGENPNFNYSLIEMSVRQGKTLKFELGYREGEQTFVLMPFEQATASLMLTVKRGSEVLAEGKKGADGNVVVTIPCSKQVKQEDVLMLEVANRGNAPVAFVVINHNTRKRCE